MPPTNTSPGAAIAITTFPYSVSLDVTGAPTGDYVPSCSSADNAVWWRFQAWTNQVAVSVRVSASGWLPGVSIWTGAPLEEASYGTGLLCRAVADAGLEVPVVAGRTYYIQVVNADAGPTSGNDLTLTVISNPVESVPDGSLLVPNARIDDAPTFPAAILDGTDGSFLQIRALTPHGLLGAVLPSGRYAIDRVTVLGATGTVDVLDDQLDAVASVDLTTFDSGTFRDNYLTSNWTDTFYAINQLGTMIVAFDGDGAIVDTWSLPVTGAVTYWWLAVTQDGTTAYYGHAHSVTGFGVIYAYDLAGDAALPNLVSTGADFHDPWDAFCAADASVLVSMANDTVRQYSGAGSLVRTFTVVSGGETLKRITYGGQIGGADEHFWAWYAPASGDARGFRQIRISDGAVLADLTDVPSTDYAASGKPPAGADWATSRWMFLPIPVTVDPVPPSPPDPNSLVIDPYPPIAPVGGWTRTNRWLRRTPHLINQNTRVFYGRSELLMDVGVAGEGVTPIVYQRYSNDGAQTWSTPKGRSYGTTAQYGKRVFWPVNASGRDRVWEWYSDSDAPARLVDAFIAVTPGTS